MQKEITPLTNTFKSPEEALNCFEAAEVKYFGADTGARRERHGS